MERIGILFWLVPLGILGLGISAAYYGDQSTALGCLVVASMMAAVCWGVRRLWKANKARGTTEDHFLHWLGMNHAAVREGTAMFRDVRITPQTELVRFTTVVSMVLMTFRTPSRFYVKGVESTGWANAAYTTATFLLGWWGFPWGLIYTPAALYRNLSGGERVSVDALLANIEIGEPEKQDAMQRA